jgi:hypothetical protein
MSNALVQIEPKTYKVTKIADMPAGLTAGAVYRDGRLYFACRSKLWSYQLKP